MRTVITLIAVALSTSLQAFQPTARQCNDSARYYFNRSNNLAAKEWAERGLASEGSPEERAWSTVILGNVQEDRGYISEAISIYERAYREAVRARSATAMAAALNGRASVLFTTGTYDSVTQFLDKSRTLDTTSLNLEKNYLVLARYLQSQNEYDQALEALQTALQHAVRANDRRNIAIITSNIGGIYFSHNPDMKFSLRYYEESNARCDSSIHFNILARNYGRMANSYMVMGDHTNAGKYLERALAIVRLSDNLMVRAYVLSSQATFLFEQGRYEESLAFMEEPIRIKRELQQVRQLQNDLLNISEAYMMVKKYDRAKQALDEGTAIAHTLKDIVYLKYFYDRKSTLDSIQGNYRSAFSNLKRSMAYKDSTFSSQHLRDVREIQEKYEAGQREKVIAEKELEIEQQQKRLVVIVAAAVILVMLLVSVMIVLRFRSRVKLQLERERQNQMRIQTIVSTQEQVQQRIARDLHDGLVQVLGAAKMALQAVGPGSEAAALQKQIRSASEIMDEAVTEARSISHQILPYSLIREGLLSALEELFARALPSYTFRRPEELAISEHKAVNIYRIVQELVNNIRKHSGATHADIVLENGTNVLRLTVQDNGNGFDPEKVKHGAGLTNMMTRAELVNGSIRIDSNDSGTTTTLTVPL